MAAGSGGIWRPYKELQAIVERSVYKRRPDVYHELEVALKKFKPDFISLLKNPARNSDHRQQLKSAPSAGLQLATHKEKLKLPEQFVQEVLILSNVLDLNEFACVELLLAGEQQQPNFPGLTRGLVAALLYHDGRRCLVRALRTLIQSREGITWTLGLGEDLTQLTTRFSDELLEEGLTTSILYQLEELSVQKELSKLERGQAIGSERHRQQLIDFITDQRQLLSECLFCFACQSPLPKKDTLQLLSYLKKCSSTEADGTLDNVTLTLLMALLYCLNVDPLDEAAEMQSSFHEETLSVLSDQRYVPEFHMEITQQDLWSNPGMGACVQFAWALLLRSCSQWSNLVGAVEVLEEDEGVLDLAVEGNVFSFLRSCVVRAANFHQEEYFVQRIHSLVTGFIVKMPLKVKELRNHGDEAARILQAHLQDGAEPPAGLARHFEDFLRLIGELYDKDPLGLELATEYWCPLDPTPVTPFSVYNSSRLSPAFRQRASQKQVSLHKFMRLAGDLLPPPLFVPYMAMLTGLATSPQAAHHCFNLLKSAANGSISWDHFFASIKQYFMDLRQDGGHTVLISGGVGVKTSHIHRPHLSSFHITPEELEGLEAVLQLTERVAEQDENSRLTLCESQAWLPIASLFGLLSCPVPVRLKARILLTLAAFAKSPEIASSMWHTLEMSQILQTVNPASAAAQQGGIQVELNELEARSETYTETRAFLKLLNNLTDIPLPVALGAGYRVPGFEPYLEFLRNDVFLRFNSRGYQDPNEKWKVASGVLEILFKLLESYAPRPEDFVDQFVEVQGGERILVPKPPGFSLMVHMLNDTPMLRMLLNVIDGASSSMELLPITAEGRSEMERAVLLCLRMVEVALEKQQQFMDMLRSIPQESALMVSPLEDLLLSVNPQSNTPDYLLKVVRFVSHLHTGAEVILCVVKILCLVCQSTTVQRHLISLLTTSQVDSQQILIGFVDQLEINEPEDHLQKDDSELKNEFIDEKSYGVLQIRNAVRQNILRLMLHSLQHPAPNLAHYLLGYELRKPVAKTNLQDPAGLLGAPKTCLHAILDILNRGLGSQYGPICVTETPKFAELAYQLIYCLCANKDTAAPTLRYLRTSHDFLYRHLQHLPFKTLVAFDTATEQSHVPMLAIVSQQSWLLKAAAVELRMTAQGRLRSHAQRLLGLLMGEQPSEAVFGVTQVPELMPRRLEEDFTAPDVNHGMYLGLGKAQLRRKLLTILESIDFSQELPLPLQLNYFDATVTEKAISSCEQKDEDSGVVFCNVPTLHKLLISEISGVQGTATAGQKNFLIQEVKDVLQNVVLRNMVRESLHVKKEAFEGWRRVIEVILASCPGDILPKDTRQAVISDVLQDLLTKIAEENALPELTSPVSGVILSLMAHLRQCTISTDAGAAPGSVFNASASGKALHVAGTSLPVGPSVAILKGLIEAVLRSGGGLQRVRANLYAALLYFMQTAPDSDEAKDKGVMENVLSLHPGQAWDTSLLPVLSSYGEPFMETVCRDSCDGHDVGRMLAFSLLDAVVAVDWQQRWLHYLTLKGYLRHMIEGLAHEDHMLQSMLDPSPEPLKALYIYESKMALLTRIAQSSEGAKVLLQAGLMSRLAECGFLDQRPEHETRTAGLTSTSVYGGEEEMASLESGFVPPVVERYRQLLMPALKVTLAILTSLGPQHREASFKVLHFVVSHVDVFISILQDRQAVHSAGSLHELGLVTGIMCNLGLTEAALSVDEELGQEQMQLRGPLARIQRLMVGLLARYCSSENWEKIVKGVMERNNEEPGAKLSLVAMETTEQLQRICSNVVGYCRTVMNSTESSTSHCHILFSPSLTDPLARDTRITREGLRPAIAMSSHLSVSLGLLLSFMKKVSDQVPQTAEMHSKTRTKQQNLTELTGEELRELSQAQYGGITQEKLSTQQRHQLAQKLLSEIIHYKSHELSSQLYIIENCLCILWRHLDFYFLHCIPSDEERRMLSGPTLASGRMRRLQELTSTSGTSSARDALDETLGLGSHVTREEIEALKTEASSSMTDSFLKKLIEIEQKHGEGRTRVGFIQVLVRRIKRLLSIHGPPARANNTTGRLR